jgi:hypothetical protein
MRADTLRADGTCRIASDLEFHAFFSEDEWEAYNL